MATPPSPTELQYMQSHIHDNRSGQLYAANVVCAFAAYLAVSLRFLARSRSKASYGIDDWLAVAALIFYTCFLVSTGYTTHYGLGRHIILVTNPKGLAATLLAAECSYNCTVPILKVSILYFYRRIFPQRWFRYSLVSLDLFVCAYSVAQFFGYIFQCVPIRKLWTPSIPGRCINLDALIIAGGVINIVTDFMILGLPMPLLWRLQIPIRKKRLLSIVFSLGVCACVAGIVRLRCIQSLKSSDPTYNDIGGLVAGAVECSVGFISACVPTYGPLVNRASKSHSSANSTAWPSRHTRVEEEHMRLSDMGGKSNKAWSTIERSSDTAEGEEVMHLYERT